MPTGHTPDAGPPAPGGGTSGSGDEPPRRREDPPLLTGEAEYTDDLRYPGTAHLALVRSQHAHARIESVETDGARAHDRVIAVYTRRDLREAGCALSLPDADPEFGVAAPRPVLCGDRVTYQGDPIAAVLAEDRYAAREGADLVGIEYDSLPAVTSVGAALADGAPTVHEPAPDNVAFRWTAGDRAGTESALSAADWVIERDLPINRIAAVPIEPRGAVARYRPAADRLIVETSAQKVHPLREHFASVLGLSDRSVTVRTPAVGGGFGVKIFTYSGQIMAAFGAMETGRPVKWIPTRSEEFLSANHARRQSVTARVGLDDRGTIEGLAVRSRAAVGGYLMQSSPLVAASNFGSRLVGAYDVPEAHVEVTGVFTNTTPLSAYRGAGRPEATYTIERLVSACARELGEDPATFRRRNFIPPGAFPCETVLGASYDSGDYEKTLDRALRTVDYGALRERQAAAREAGRYIGIGLSTYTEVCGGGAEKVEGGSIRITPEGSVVAATSMADNGQGHATGFAQVVAGELGVDYEDVEVVAADTDRVPFGQGTGGSMAMALAGNALGACARSLRERAREIAAHELEAPVGDVVAANGKFHIDGAPGRSVTMAQLARAAHSGAVPPDLRGLEETVFFSPDGPTAPFGAHVAVVSVDPETGAVEIERYVAVDDVGRRINPALVEGQIHGGVVQGIGQALHEGVSYDGAGNLQTASLQDYAVPTSVQVPEIETDATVTPSPNNPLGVKGVGEAGAIGATPAVVNAVRDALEPLGVDGLEMPLTQERVWRAVREAGGPDQG